MYPWGNWNFSLPREDFLQTAISQDMIEMLMWGLHCPCSGTHSLSLKKILTCQWNIPLRAIHWCPLCNIFCHIKAISFWQHAFPQTWHPTLVLRKTANNSQFSEGKHATMLIKFHGVNIPGYHRFWEELHQLLHRIRRYPLPLQNAVTKVESSNKTFW